MKILMIGQVARQAGVGVETVRYYERQGLLAEPARRAAGYRVYDEEVVSRLCFIRSAKQLGFSLKEIAGLLDLRHDPKATRADVRRQTQTKIADIDDKIRDLQRMREALLTVTDTCHGDGPAANCPILEALNRPVRA